MTVRALVLVLTFTAALLAGRLTAPAPEPAPVREAGDAAGPAKAAAGDELAALPLDCDVRRTHFIGERRPLEGEVEEARLELRMQVAAREAREGPPQPWTDDVAPELRPESFEAAVREAVEAAGVYGDVEFDCDEVPCLVAVTWETPENRGSDARNLESLWEALGERGYDVSHRSASASSWPRQHGVLAIPPPDPSGDLRKRTAFRMKRMLDRRMEQLAEEAP